jgi:uncharacterized protein YdeI (YjbR/CyaY-like superfamily)
MPKKEPRVDAYIVAAAPFAQPILEHLRKVMHAGCPSVEETIKWGFPRFDYHGIITGMAAFRQHCAFGFWKGALLFGPGKAEQSDAMGHFGRITKVVDLPNEKTLVAFVRKAAKLNEDGVKVPTKPRTARVLEVPEDFNATLLKNARARETFESFSTSKRNEYVEWVTEAKREETRRQRVATSIEWLAEGKSHSWKYQRKR